jgi:hypothetical protein
MGIIENYNRIQDSVRQKALDCGRNPDEITIIAVSKTFPVEDINEAIRNKIRIFGENKIQEAKIKSFEIIGNYSFHLIGHLQSNKAKDAVSIFDMIHSIDKLSTAEKVDREAAEKGKIQQILIQVNTSGEESKSGCSPEEAVELCTKISRLQNINVNGLMTIGPNTDTTDIVKQSFSLLRSLRDEMRCRTGISLNELSMGMSGDYEIAIEEGATMLRIGSAIFGKRTYT